MSLKPKRVNFDETWQELRQTVKEVITLGNVKRNIWSDRFRFVHNVCIHLCNIVTPQDNFIRQKKYIIIYVSFHFQLNSDVYSLCVAFPEPLADRLYNETKQFLENHVQNILATQVVRSPDSIVETSNGGTQTLLHRYYSAWMEYSQGVEYLNYLYL
jgi:cullin 2